MHCLHVSESQGGVPKARPEESGYQLILTSLKDLDMVVVGKHFTFLLIVVEWLKSNHLTAKI